MINFIIKHFDSQLLEINSIINDVTLSKSNLTSEIAYHLIGAGGKKIRPLLMLATAEMLGVEDKSILNLAAVVEMIHNAGLLHDDVIDNSKLRRGKATANTVWDNKFSVLVGDFLFAGSFQLMVSCGNIKVLELLSRASKQMVAGEIIQLQKFGDTDLTIEEYIEIVSGKTAVLFSASTATVATIANLPIEKIADLQNFGKYLGIIFQIVDDILDYKANQEVFGKKLGLDFLEGKVTIPIIATLSVANREDALQIKQFFLENFQNTSADNSEDKNNIIQESPQFQEDFKKIIEKINKYQGFEISIETAKKYQNMAEEILNKFPDSSAKEYLKQILLYTISRIY